VEEYIGAYLKKNKHAYISTHDRSYYHLNKCFTLIRIKTIKSNFTGWLSTIEYC